jgi:hypothetical protein
LLYIYLHYFSYDSIDDIILSLDCKPNWHCSTDLYNYWLSLTSSSSEMKNKQTLIALGLKQHIIHHIFDKLF